MLVLLSTLAFAEDLPGKASFTQFCVTCHGESGAGDGPAGAALNPKPRDFTSAEFWAQDGVNEDYLKALISGGGASQGKSPLMPAWGPVLGDDKVAEVAAYVMTFKPADEADAE